MVLAALMFQLDRYRPLAAVFAGLGFVATVLIFLLRGAALTGDAGGMTVPEMLGLLWSTPVGDALALRLTGLGLLVAGLLLGRIGLWISAAGGVIAIWSFDHVGHVSDRDITLLDAALTLHLIGIALWIGILAPLRRLASHRATWHAAIHIGHRFGIAASITVPILIVAGSYMSFALIGSFGALVDTGYGRMLILKVVAVSGLLGLAALNKLRFIPGLKAGDAQAARHLCRSIWLEWVAVLAILAATAILTSVLTLPN